MAFQISRLYDFQPGTKILSSQVDNELNQLVTSHNNLDDAFDGFKTTLASSVGSTLVGITPVTGLDPTVNTLQKFILSEVSARLAHIEDISNPHGVTNSQVGLGNVINVKQATETAHLNHVNNTSNPHSVTKAQVGLGNVDNTSDIDKPVSSAQASELMLKVDKETGKSLIANNLITKLQGIAAGAEVNVQSDWSQTDNSKDDYIKNKPSLGTAAALNVGTGSGNIPILDATGKLAVTTIPATVITLVDQLLRQGMVIDLPQVVDTPHTTSFHKVYSFSLPTLQFLTDTTGASMAFLDNAYIDLDIKPSNNTYTDREIVCQSDPVVSSVSITDTVDDTDPHKFKLSGSFTIDWVNPLSTGIDIIIKPRLVIPPVSGVLVSYN